MKISHIALWVKNIEVMREFYTNYFDATTKAKYKNEKKSFESYFLSFEDGARLEIMQMPEIPDNGNDPVKQHIGFIHIAFSVGSTAARRPGGLHDTLLRNMMV